ncbi:type I restriction-modification system subunit M [Bernardetia sp. ABR2-2B]|uniref:type I restriction-modification system subunit M n=1 Tax=Bernardetia sp. ABR2-2B TaxID=3127472 RepID=UPI0030CBCAAB
MSEEQRRLLERKLWDIADELRGKMDADEYRDYILGFIFYKYLSEKQYIFANNLLQYEEQKDYRKIKDQGSLDVIKDESIGTLGFFLKPNELFSSVVEKGLRKRNDDVSEEEQQENFVINDLSTILLNVQSSTMGQESEEEFDNLFEDLDLHSTKLGRSPKDRNILIVKILAHLDKIDFQLENLEADVLGDAYEYLIGQFASGAGKKAGEFYTPQEVSTILARLVTIGKKKLKTVYDPTCGSGSLLLRVRRQVEKVGEFYGQELNRTTYNLARMNMILHDVHYTQFNIQQADTLEDPKHTDLQFEAIVANPPFSAKWTGKKNPLFSNDDRFSQYGSLAPSSKADFAFVQHMIYHLADNGTMACVLPHGVLFRGAAEGRIREYIIKEMNYLDAVIGLPANIFYGTSIPTCILVLSKCRVNSDNVLFIDASNHFAKEKNQNKLLPSDIERILNAYTERKNIDKYAYVASLEEIAENDYNLNIPRYVDTFEEEEKIDVDAVLKELKEVETELSSTDTTIDSFCKELGIENPFN